MTAVAARELSDIIFANAESLTDTDYKRSLDLLKVIHDAKAECRGACAECKALDAALTYLNSVNIELREDARFWRVVECGMLHDVIAERNKEIAMLRSRLEVLDAAVRHNCPRKAPRCKTCGQPRKGHARGPCMRV